MKKFHTFLVALPFLLAPLIANADTLKICYETWEPFHFQVDGKHKGIQVELMNKAAASLGHTVTYRDLPYARCIKEVKNGNFDAILLTSGEEPLVPATVSTAFWEIGIIARPDWPSDTYTALGDFDGKRVGLVTAYDYGEAITVARKKWHVETSTDAVSNLRKISVGRMDITITDVPWAQLIAKQQELELKVMSPTLQSYPQFTYFTTEKADYAGPVGQALQQFIDDGSVDALYQTYVNQSFTEVKKRNSETLIK